MASTSEERRPSRPSVERPTREGDALPTVRSLGLTSSKSFRRISQPEQVGQLMEPKIAGYVLKRTAKEGGRKLKRYAVVVDSFLLYYKSVQEYPLYPRAVIPLQNCDIAVRNSAVVLTHPSVQPLVLQPEGGTDELLNQWLSALLDAKLKSQMQSLVEKELTTAKETLTASQEELLHLRTSLLSAQETEKHKAEETQATQTQADRASPSDLQLLRERLEETKHELISANAMIQELEQTRAELINRSIRHDAERDELDKSFSRSDRDLTALRQQCDAQAKELEQKRVECDRLRAEMLAARQIAKDLSDTIASRTLG